MPELTSETLADLFKEQLNALAALDKERLLATYTEEDCVLRDMSDPENPFTGREEIGGFLDEYFSNIEEASVKILTLSTNEDTATGEIEVHATYVGFPFSASNGRKVTIRYAVFDTFHDGKVSYERFYWDPADLERQLAQA